MRNVASGSYDLPKGNETNVDVKDHHLNQLYCNNPVYLKCKY